MTTRTRIVLAIAALALARPGVAAAQPSLVRVTVDEAVSRAFEASHRLAEGRARQSGAEAAVRVRQSADRPTVTATAGYSRTNHVEEFGFPLPGGGLRVIYPDVPDNVITRVGFQWPIYTAGRTDALERAAAAEVSAVGADIETTRADLRLEVVRAYWGLATANEIVRVLTASLERADSQLKDARDRLAVGITPPNEVLSFEAQRSQEELQLIEARDLRESSLIEVRRLIDADPGAEIELADRLDATVLTPAPADQKAIAVSPDLLAQRPERKALTLRITGAEARQQAAAAGRRPIVGVGGGADLSNPNPRIFPREKAWQSSWDLSVNVSWPVFDGGRTKAETAEARAAVDAARERLAELDMLLATDIRQRSLDLASARAAVRAAEDGVRSAAEARRVVGERFTVGVATNTDVLLAQEAILRAELARARALAGVRLAEARLQRALGRP